MKTNPVTINLSRDDEWDLMEIFGRKCSREGLVLRAIDFAIKSKGTEKKEVVKKARKKRGTPANGLDEGKQPEAGQAT